MAWDTYTTTATQIDNTIVNLYSRLIIYAATPELVADQVANVREEIFAKAIVFPLYSNLTKITSALTEADDATSVQLTDSAVTLTPAEYGNVVTRTLLTQVQSAGKVDEAAAFLCGRNMGVSLDGLAITALDAFGGTTIYPNAATLPPTSPPRMSWTRSLREGSTTSSPVRTSPDSSVGCISESPTMTFSTISVPIQALAGGVMSVSTPIRSQFSVEKSGCSTVFAGSGLRMPP